jgi:hypothetical protein
MLMTEKIRLRLTDRPRQERQRPKRAHAELSLCLFVPCRLSMGVSLRRDPPQGMRSD